MKLSTLLLVVAGLALAACQSESKPNVPANTPPEENAAPVADTTGRK